MKLVEQRTAWLDPPPEYALGAHEVHLWRASLMRDRQSQETAWAVLAEDEKQRARRYRVEPDREFFIARRGILRFLLGKYLAIPAAQVSLTYNPYGKPLLASGYAGDRLHFSLSCSCGQALYAFTRLSRVGVDLERVRSDPAVLELAQAYFTPNEVKSLDLLTDEARRRAFFQCWTRKEALLKALGAGLTISPDQIDVSLDPGRPAQIGAVYGEAEPLRGFHLVDIDAGDGFAAALALERQAHSLRCWQFSGLN